jgi:hypothetical protein
MRYQRPRNAEWVALVYRYDSGLVVSGVPDSDFALNILSNAQQTSIGLSCGSLVATFSTGLGPDDCAGKVVKSTLVVLPQAGQENDDHNPDRVKPRNLFNLGIGTDNLLHSEGPRRFTASIQVENLTNKVALYNFLSTFSGTHFVPPRTVVAKVGLVF